MNSDSISNAYSIDLEIPTMVAHAGFEEHWFRGRKLFEDLAGRSSFWELAILAVGGPKIGQAAQQILDDISTCCTVADPRIPPMKLTRLAAAYGGETAAFCAGLLFLDNSLMGPAPLIAFAKLLVASASDAYEGGVLNSVRIERSISSYLDSNRRIPGFGVPFRAKDERVIALGRCLENTELVNRRYRQILEVISEYLSRTKQLEPNIDSLAAAVCLDMDLPAHVIESIAPLFFLPCFLANAAEGAQQAPAILQKLPSRFATWEGVKPRLSPRAIARTSGPQI